jgi:type I restriction enzyme S subunit
LDKAQALIDARKEQIRLMDDLVQSVFYEMFGDSKTNSKEYATYKLEELGKVGSSKRVFVDDLVENGIPFYRGTEVGSLAEGITISPKLFITEEHFVQLKNATGIPQKGDLLMPSICPDGRIWRVNTDEAFYFKDGRVLWVNVKSNDINSIYLQYALKDKFLNDYSNIASGTTFAELKIFALKNIDILMPNIELQNQYADFINQIDKMKLKVQKPLDEIEILFDLLMQKYFE